MEEEAHGRSEGVTAAERYLARLCDKSFLRLWSYSGIYRDQAAGSKNSEGKEVCDLLVLFDRHVIIFSDKDCAFPDHPDIQIAWKRWAKRAIFSSAKQLYGVNVGCAKIQAVYLLIQIATPGSR